jgi:KDO2-lipid IV(A) lauroyltransferase
VVAGAAALIGRLPPSVGLWLGRRAGDVTYAALGRRRRLALANIAAAFPALSEAERRTMCRRAYRHLGMVAVDVSRVLSSVERLLPTLRVEGTENLDAAMATSGCALAVTAHLGSWELLSLVPALIGHPISLVVRPLDAGWLDPLIARVRQCTGIEVIAKQRAARSMLEALRRRRVVALLMDQNASRREGIFVPFFGRLASTSRSAAVLALRTGAPIVPVFIRREQGFRHVVSFEPALPRPENGGEAAVIELTTRCTEAIERAIRAAPEQWLWMHDRWRTRPPAETSAP